MSVGVLIYLSVYLCFSLFAIPHKVITDLYGFFYVLGQTKR